MNKRIFPFFLIQFFGAFNDNLFKSALIIIIAYQTENKEYADQLVQLSAGVFILPFLLFSALSGQMSDSLNRRSLIQIIKFVEILIMSLAVIGFIKMSILPLIFILFLMGTQSTFFGPIKYSCLTDLGGEDKLIKTTALISSSTFVAILLGSILGGILASSSFLSKYGLWPLNLSLLVISILGYIPTLFMPHLSINDSNLKIDKKFLKPTLNLIKTTKSYPEIHRSLHAISWYWFFGFFFMASLPSFCRDILKGDEWVATFLLAILTIGVSVGAFLCEKLSKKKINLGYTSIGALGLSFSGILIALSGNDIELILGYLNINQFLTIPSNYFVIIYFFLSGFFGGFYTTPLYSYIQKRSPSHLKARVIASNNILNSLYMVSAAITAMFLFAVGLKINQIFFIISLVNIIVLIMIIKNAPLPFLRLISINIFKLFYRVQIIGEENIPRQGRVVMASNHVSFLDPPLLGTHIKRECFFLMDKAYYDIKWMNWFFRLVDAIPVLPRKIDESQASYAIDKICAKLENEKMVIIFPEGFITRDGNLSSIKNGLSEIVNRTKCPVIPTVIIGLWGSWFSRHKGSALKGVPIPRFRKIIIKYGPPIYPSDYGPEALKQALTNLLNTP